MKIVAVVGFMLLMLFYPRPGTPAALYAQSWAVVIGIDDYRTWPKLEFAVNDAKSVRDRLIRLGFDAGQILELYNREATKENILRVVADELPRKTGPDDRVLFFFAGHGQTEELHGGIRRGYLIPVDGDLENLYSKSIPMNVLADISLRTPAKHILFVMDACYSGLALARAASLPPQTPGFLQKVTAARARQIITAGGAGEQVFERDGHGLFTKRLLEALDGAADDNRDGIITASELASYLRWKVSTESSRKQNPVFGIMEGEGEFVFMVPPGRDSTAATGKGQEGPRVTERTGEEGKPKPQAGEVDPGRPADGLVQYHLLVTHLDFATFASYLDTATPGPSGAERMGRLEARLDRLEFPSTAVIPGREVQLLTDAGYGGKAPVRFAVVPTPRNQSWTTLAWEGRPGETVAFVVKSEMQAWQEVRAVAANPEGALRRLSIGGPSLFGGASREVPEASYDFLANAVDRGTFTRWLEQHARALNGMAVAIGRGRAGIVQTADRVYALITPPPEPRTFKLVIGWAQPERPRDPWRR
jgi:hypothetical protein